MRANRDFMRRVGRYLAAEMGIRQFLDVGPGLATEPNLHEVVQGIVPESRIVYVENDHSKSGCAHADGLVRLLEADTGAEALKAFLGAPQSTDSQRARHALSLSFTCSCWLCLDLTCATIGGLDGERPADLRL